jgi:signal transduction histidine kinase
MLVQLREAFGAALIEAQRHNVRQITVTGAANSNINTCLIVPLRDGTARIGWIELYLERPVTLATDEQALLETIAGEIAEAVVSARRRSREERAIYELERAIADERARIARDIHDGLAQTLAFRRMRVDLWLQWLADDPQRVREELVDLKDTLRDQITELRRAIFALRPIQFDTLGFAGGLHRYIVEFANQHGWDAQVDLGAVPSALSPEIEATCFRIVQESLTNAAKHARATQIIVVIDHIDDGLAVVVRDNGRGFAPGESSREPANRIGLRQMRERLAAIHGQLTLLSHPGGGTEVRAWIPLRTIDTRGGCHDISATALSRRSPHLSSGPA